MLHPQLPRRLPSQARRGPTTRTTLAAASDRLRRQPRCRGCRCPRRRPLAARQARRRRLAAASASPPQQRGARPSARPSRSLCATDSEHALVHGARPSAEQRALPAALSLFSPLSLSAWLVVGHSSRGLYQAAGAKCSADRR